MSDIREIKNRIVSVKKTQQITRAMKMMAGVKFRKAEQQLLALRPYIGHLQGIVHEVISRHNALHDTRYRKTQFDKHRSLLIMVLGDRGLCGNFNSSVLRKALKFANDQRDLEHEHHVDFLVIGKKGFGPTEKSAFELIHSQDSELKSYTEESYEKLLAKILELYPGYDKVHLLFNRFRSMISRDLEFKQILPVDAKTSVQGPVQDFLYEFEEDVLLEELLQMHLLSVLQEALLESTVSEESARMTAMDSATKNADDMIRSLTLQFNRVRQAAITKEIIEIASGAEALGAV